MEHLLPSPSQAKPTTSVNPACTILPPGSLQRFQAVSREGSEACRGNAVGRGVRGGGESQREEGGKEKEELGGTL